MITLEKKIDFAVVFQVTKANPNGDPLNGNRPRIDYEGYGEVTDVCIKRKIRDRLQEKGENILIQSDDRKNDNHTSIEERAKGALGKKFGSKETSGLACEKWFDVRAFGQLFALPKSKGNKNGDEDNSDDTGGVSIGIRGPVSIHSAFSIEPISQVVTSTQITKSVSGKDTKGGKRSSDTMGMKHRVDRGIYVFYGSMNPQLAEKTGFSAEDAGAIKKVLPILFENDASSARPEGSMEVLKVIWWEHNCKSGQYSSAKVHHALTVQPDGNIKFVHLEGLTPEEIPGF